MTGPQHSSPPPSDWGQPYPPTTPRPGRNRAVLWGALAVAALAVAGVIYAIVDKSSGSTTAASAPPPGTAAAPSGAASSAAAPSGGHVVTFKATWTGPLDKLSIYGPGITPISETQSTGATSPYVKTITVNSTGPIDLTVSLPIGGSDTCEIDVDGTPKAVDSDPYGTVVCTTSTSGN